MILRCWLTALLLPAALATETPPPPLQVSVEEVLDSVDRTLPLLVAASARVEAASGKRLGAMGWLDPRLSAQGGGRWGQYEHVFGRVAIEQDTPLWGLSMQGGWRIGDGVFPRYETIVTTQEAGELFVTAYLPLLQGGAFDRARAEVLRAEAEFEGAEATYQAERVQLRFAARQAWASWVATGARLQLAQEIRRLAAITRDAVVRRATRGAAAEIDTLDARRAVLERDADVEAARRDLIASGLDLGLYWRTADGHPRTLSQDSPPSLPELPAAPPVYDADALVREAIDRRPEVAAIDARRRAAEASLRLARVNVLPKLNLMGHVERDLPTATFTDPILDTKVGAVLEFPLALRKGRGDLVTAKADIATIDAQRTWLVDRVANEVRTAVARADAAWVQARNTAEAALLSAEVADGTRRAWEAGARDLLEVWLRDQQRFQVETRAIGAWREWFVAEAALRAAVGRP